MKNLTYRQSLHGAGQLLQKGYPAEAVTMAVQARNGKSGSRYAIRLGDRMIMTDDDFELALKHAVEHPRPALHPAGQTPLTDPPRGA